MRANPHTMLRAHEAWYSKKSPSSTTSPITDFMS